MCTYNEVILCFSLESKLGNDENLDRYYVYVEAMFRQAIDPSFLKRIKAEEGETNIYSQCGVLR